MCPDLPHTLQDMLRDLADILSCSTVGVAAFVTACYYILVLKGEIHDSKQACPPGKALL